MTDAGRISSTRSHRGSGRAGELLEAVVDDDDRPPRPRLDPTVLDLAGHEVGADGSLRSSPSSPHRSPTVVVADLELGEEGDGLAEAVGEPGCCRGVRGTSRRSA